MAQEAHQNRVARTLNEFLHLESAGGFLLMAAASLAILVANSPLDHFYHAFLESPVEIRVGPLELAKPLLLWVNDGLMAVFFFLVGLEVKREILEGHLSTLRQASLPAFGAVGGMVAPALIYWFFNASDPVAVRGWAIPAATDIAFALGVLTLLGSRVPPAIKAFLLSVAIFDDLGAIVVIAIYYTDQLSNFALVASGVLIAGLALLNYSRVYRVEIYWMFGIALWIAVLKTGVHATLAGVVVAAFIPLHPKASPRNRYEQSPLRYIEQRLHPWVAFAILPIFAFTNAGVPLAGVSFADLLNPIPLGILAGLVVGKQVGVFSACWIATRMGLASLPTGTTWAQIYATSILCGIGFTMSLFIASLAFKGGTAYPGLERLGILAGSLLAGVWGYFALRAATRKTPAATEVLTTISAGSTP